MIFVSYSKPKGLMPKKKISMNGSLKNIKSELADVIFYDLDLQKNINMEVHIYIKSKVS